MDELTPDDVRHWDLSVIEQLFHAAKGVQREHQNFGDTLDNAHSRTNWHGESGDAFREELGKPRRDLEADGTESKAVATAVENAEHDIKYCRDTMLGIYDRAGDNGWAITSDWRVDDTNANHVGKTHDPQLLQNDLDQLKTRAHAADHELGVAVRAAVGDAHVDAQGHEAPGQQPIPGDNHEHDAGAQQRPGVTDVNDPGVQWQPGFNPRQWDSSWHNPLLADNPPGYTGGPGPARDQAWQNYLAHFPGTKDASGQIPRGYLPNPDAVSDPGLKVLGNAGTQLGTSYAWGGNQSTTGPSKGHPGPGGATTYNDGNRVGYDCGGLVRYSVDATTGHDPFDSPYPQKSGTDRLDSSSYLTHSTGGVPASAVGQFARPGDVLVFGDPGRPGFSIPGTSTDHTGIYVGNGVMINAPESGLPVQLNDIAAQQGTNATDVLGYP